MLVFPRNNYIRPNKESEMRSLLFLIFLAISAVTFSQTETEYSIIGKWTLFEDVEENGLTRAKATMIFKENGGVIMFSNTKDKKEGKYVFDFEVLTLEIEGELVNVEVVDKDNLKLLGKHPSGTEFTSQLVRVN